MRRPHADYYRRPYRWPPGGAIVLLLLIGGLLGIALVLRGCGLL